MLKTSFFSSRLSALRSSLIVFLIIFLFLYASLAAYLKFIASAAVNEAIQKIERINPNITQIHYQYLEFSPLDFLKQRLVLKNVTAHINNPKLDLHLESLFISDFMSFTKDPLGDFDIAFKGAQVSPMAGLYALLSTWINNPYLYKQLNNLPDALDLNFDGAVHYAPVPDHEADLFLNINNKNLPLFNYQINVSNLQLSPAFFNNMAVFLQTLAQSQILHIHYQADIDYVLRLEDISNFSPGLGRYLASLGYDAFPIRMSGNSDYQGSDTTEAYHFDVDVKDVGSLTMDINYLVASPPSLANMAYQFLGAVQNPTLNNMPDLIESATLNYKDDSLVHRIIQEEAQSSGQSYQATQAMIITTINNLALNLKIPQMIAIAGALNAFISKPQNLSLHFRPTVPFSADDVINFFAAQQHRNQLIEERLNQLPPKTREKAYNTYLQQSFNAYSSFFNRIGLSIFANSDQ